MLHSVEHFHSINSNDLHKALTSKSNDNFDDDQLQEQPPLMTNIDVNLRQPYSKKITSDDQLQILTQSLMENMF